MSNSSWDNKHILCVNVNRDERKRKAAIVCLRNYLMKLDSISTWSFLLTIITNHIYINLKINKQKILVPSLKWILVLYSLININNGLQTLLWLMIDAWMFKLKLNWQCFSIECEIKTFIKNIRGAVKKVQLWWMFLFCEV